MEEVVKERAIPKPDATRGIVGYRLWRLLPGQENNPETWATLTNNPVPAMEYDDYSWATVPAGTYKWAVRTSYHMGVESTPAFSNTLEKKAKTTFTVNITTNSGDSPAGAEVTLSNTGAAFNAIAMVNQVIFNNVELGTYTLKVTLSGYHDYTTQVEILGPDVHLATLIEIIKNPFDLAVDTICNNALLTWKHELAGGKHLKAFSVYLNGDKVAGGINGTEYLLEGLEIGAYTAGVEANYSSGNSDIVTVNFVIGCLGIDDNDLGYKLYPNPATNHLIVERTASIYATIDIYNAMGMHIATYETGEVQYEISVAALAAGTYFVRVTEGSNSSVKSFVKK